MKQKCLKIATLTFAITMGANLLFAQDTQKGAIDFYGASIAGKVWFVSGENDFTDDYSGTLYGLTANYSFTENFSIMALGLFGSVDTDSGLNKDEIDAEFCLAYNFDFFALGGGARYSKESFGQTKNDAYGPMIFAGVGTYIFDTDLSWYATGSWMFTDLGDSENMEHYVLEGGLAYTWEHIVIKGGYRYKDYYESEINYKEHGFTASLGYMFY